MTVLFHCVLVIENVISFIQSREDFFWYENLKTYGKIFTSCICSMHHSVLKENRDLFTMQTAMYNP